ncbi:MAG: cation diffusion facilitator family transporter [Succinivibrio sp.]|nr:cation diffusion facilitator family transporter [Succinivibrio sp.]
MLAGLASVSTAALCVFIKLAVWMMSSSSSIFASLTDSLFDSLASVVNLLALKYSMAPADRDHRYGHFKAQSLASLAQAAFIGGSAVLLIAHGVERFMHPQTVQHVEAAITVSAITMVLTLLLVLFQSYVYKRTRSEAIGADRLHFVSDLLLNTGVIVALVLSLRGMLWSDGIFAAIIGLLILKGAVQIGIRATNTLLDRSLPLEEIQTIRQTIIAVNGVESIHDLKTRRAGPQTYIQGHLVIAGDISLYDAHNIASRAEESLEKIYPDADISLHMEPDNHETRDGIRFDTEVPPVHNSARQ